MSESIEQIREKAALIVDRLKTDPTFKAQVEQHPESTLVAAGLPTNAVADFLTDMQKESSEVSGYVVVGCDLSCICTGCCNTN